MTSYRIFFTRNADKLLKKINKFDPIYSKKVQEVISDISEHPRTGIGHPKALIGGNDIIWSRRISKKDRVVYEIHDDTIIVNILSIEGHYNDK